MVPRHLATVEEELKEEASPSQLQLALTFMGELISCPPWFTHLFKGLLLGPGWLEVGCQHNPLL